MGAQIRKFINKPRETTKLYSEVPTVYMPLIDLGTDYIYEHLVIINNLLIDISLRFQGDHFLTFFSDIPIVVYDGLSFNNVVDWKGLGETSEGSLVVQAF